MEKWTVDEKEETSKEIEATVSTDSELKKHWPQFKADVATNPFYHTKPKRIAKLAGTNFPPGTYRYKRGVLRVVYFPDKPSRTVFPLEAAHAVDVSYKKRSSRKIKIPRPKSPQRP